MMDEKEEPQKDTTKEGLAFREEMFEEYEDKWNTHANPTEEGE